MTESPSVVVRPRKSRIACWVSAVLFAGTFFVLSFFMGTTTAAGGVFHPADQVAMILLGLFGAALFLLFTRPVVRADSHGIWVRNIGSFKYVPWQVVERVSFPRGMSWATLELADDDEMSMMAIQKTDRELAIQAVRDLRALLEGFRTAEGDDQDG
ncbi:PH domain-containing protein [Natronoglycomyces albus]|uniref:PH domain-containing protein n=2 Tax=Natronoglycomyces albus TaxID=2811108 RepID=A0A895XXV6_9ACTN|nr:PH domain-containing protein [Natronoglycomyces albus]